jgi:hypothetical protein
MFETTPNPNALKITLEHKLEVGADYFEIQESNPELVNELLSIEGITSIFIGPSFLTVLKKHEYAWKDIETRLEELL